MYRVVDLFAGPGGLAEGFSAVRDKEGRRVFELALSVEKEASAFRTLRLRSFTRQFVGELPHTYYDYVAGRISREELASCHPEEWARACDETLQLELGSPGSEELIDPLLDAIRDEAGGETILVGGPPCQAYSTVGRARNKGVAGYVAREDHRHFLYREYIRILRRLKPAAFVMENVKGFLSAKIDGQSIFRMVKADLESAGGEAHSYSIFPLTDVGGRGGREHVIEAEKYGIPQARHRVILFGIRTDLAVRLGGLVHLNHRLHARNQTKVEDVLSGMPPLRSRLSRSADSDETWRSAVLLAFQEAATAVFEEEDDALDVLCPHLMQAAETLKGMASLPPYRSIEAGAVTDNVLADWLVDPLLRTLPNHEARSHMTSDLARYAYAATFAKVFGRSPKAGDFPIGLAPDHQNWTSGAFKDRFRVQCWGGPSTTVTSHISKDGHYFIHPDPLQCRALTVREAARLQTFPDNYLFEGNRTEQYIQVGNAVPPLLALQIAEVVARVLS
ncbi:DNA cytosine methyltransferase [Sphingomonas carotinifaciens]|uniref:DNA cytosine methyltransferase n=1 Tax=Sphingomonas carotinifaciens TaxID=1166323 RepID=UPI0039A179A9